LNCTTQRQAGGRNQVNLRQPDSMAKRKAAEIRYLIGVRGLERSAT
jgi:hypothetical protein